AGRALGRQPGSRRMGAGQTCRGTGARGTAGGRDRARDSGRTGRSATKMNIVIITDAWEPQVNGVVRTLTQTRLELQRMGHRVELITPLDFRTLPCPTYPEIR